MIRPMNFFKDQARGFLGEAPKNGPSQLEKRGSTIGGDTFILGNWNAEMTSVYPNFFNMVDKGMRQTGFFCLHTRQEMPYSQNRNLKNYHIFLGRTNEFWIDHRSDGDFHSHGGSPNGWFVMENLMKIRMIWGYRDTPISGNLHIYLFLSKNWHHFRRKHLGSPASPPVRIGRQRNICPRNSSRQTTTQHVSKCRMCLKWRIAGLNHLVI